MNVKKLWAGIDRTARVALAAGIIALTGMTVWAGVNYATTPAADAFPTLRFRCMDFKLIEDGSIQALVRISMENIEYFEGTSASLEFNPNYIQLSSLETVDGKIQQSLVETGDHHRVFFEENPALKVNGRSPFAGGEGDADDLPADGPGFGLATQGEQSTTPGEPTTPGEMSVTLVLDNDDLVTTVNGHSVIQWMNKLGEKKDPPTYMYIDASGVVDDATGLDGYTLGTSDVGGVNLGALSFKVNPDNLTDMVTNYGSNFIIGLNTREPEQWHITELVDIYGSGEYDHNQRTDDEVYGSLYRGLEPPHPDLPDPAQVVFDFIFPDVLVKAEVAGGNELTVNAYQAYTTGTIDDIASTVQRYRPEIKGTKANAEEELFVMNWGNTAEGYAVYRPAQTGETPDYTRSDGSGWKTLNSSDYSPKGGEYLVIQDFYYYEGDENGDGITDRKKYPLPMEVKLTVTQVKLESVNATNLTATYSETEAQYLQPTTDLQALELPKKAVLGLFPVPGPTTMTMEIKEEDWTKPGSNDPVSIATLTDAVTGNAWGSAGGVDGYAGTFDLAGPQTTKITDYVHSHCPWVTTDAFTGSINAQRIVVPDLDYVNINIDYQVEHVVDADGRLHLRVKKEQGGNAKDFETTRSFKTYLPTGIQIDTDTELPTTPVAGGNGASSSAAVTGAEAALIYNPGNYSTGSDHQQDVRRAINLGGWFYVSVGEDFDGDGIEPTEWVEMIPVYVPPRDNIYTKDETFDFTGLQAGLYPFYKNSVLPTNVVLPLGYTVATTYDGSTGAEPGALGRFRVGSWGNPVSAYSVALGTHDHDTTDPLWSWCDGDIVTYGPDSFAESTNYTGFGKVVNTNTPDPYRTVQMRLEPRSDDFTGQEDILLTHEGSDHTGITWLGSSPDEVDGVTYTIQSKNYVDRQVFTLTIVNNGTVPIYGLTVDVNREEDHTPTLTDEPNASPGPHFEVTRQPSPDLAPGGKTTFDITYVYNLSTKQGGSINYKDWIHIFSNNNGDPTDPLHTFWANFEVTDQEVYRVDIDIISPTYPTGYTGPVDSGKIIVGPATKPTIPSGTSEGGTIVETGDPANRRPNESTATNTYAANHEYVWIFAEPGDENLVEEVYYEDGLDGSGNPIKKHLYVYEYQKDPTLATDADSTAYFFEMPAKDVTVHIKFYEPISAKLRLQSLLAFAGTTADEILAANSDSSSLYTLIDSASPDKHRHKVRLYKDSATIIDDPMSPAQSSADKPNNPAYLVVLGDYDDNATASTDSSSLTRVELQATLRINPLEPDIDDVTVTMTDAGQNLYTDYDGKTYYADPTGAAPTIHTSGTFDAPEPTPEVGHTQKTILITLSCRVTTNTPDYPTASTTPVEVTRTFEVVIVRKSKTPDHTLGYGNSPKGMIYNDSALATDAAKAARWTTFVDDNYRFGTTDVPAKAVDLTNVYWPEAWGDPDLSTTTNYDADETALFITLGQPFQDPGITKVKNSVGMDVATADITRSVTVKRLDTTAAATTQHGRFNGLRDATGAFDTVDLDLGTATDGLVTSTTTITDWWKSPPDSTGATTDYAIRPGIYELEYSFVDYDGVTVTTVTRPLIILSPVGDVNADYKVDDTDVDLIRRRAKEPLGSMAAPGYDEWLLFRYRCTDVNNDRKLNNIDSNRISYGYKYSPSNIVQYYKPTDYVS